MNATDYSYKKLRCRGADGTDMGSRSRVELPINLLQSYM